MNALHALASILFITQLALAQVPDQAKVVAGAERAFEKAAEKAAKINPAPAPGPESVIKKFYNGYIRATARGVEPLGKRSALRRYLTANIIRTQVDAYEASQEADYFLQSQEYNAEWENAFTISNLTIKGATATAIVDFPGGYPRVKVTLRKVAALWKIDGVENAQR